MPRLCVEDIENGAWTSDDTALPQFSLARMRAATRRTPIWAHIGAGNLFRGFIASLQQQLLDEDLAVCGIVAAEAFDCDIIEKIYRPYDNLTLAVGMRADGSTQERLVASVADAYRADAADAAQLEALTRVFTASSLQLVSFTITEKGYALTDMGGAYLPVVAADLQNGPDRARHTMSLTTALLYARYRAGARPVAMVSMDNCSGNGDKLRTAVLTVAEAWQAGGFVEAEFVKYLSDGQRVSFPWTMIDKITPRPSEEVRTRLAARGIDLAPVVTDKGTFIAPYVNSEIPQYLVVEDDFPNGRPCLEKAGVYFTDRETVSAAERMKVTACLNPLHTALAIFGCLLGYESIADEMADEDLRKLVTRIGYDEGLPVVADPKIIRPRAFLEETLTQRLPNPFIPDTPQRIATDTSQKISIRFGETIKAYAARPDMRAETLTCIPLALAGWCRYLLGTDDKLCPMTLSSDPLLDVLRPALEGVVAGRPESYRGQLRPMLSNPALFGADLFQVGLGDRVEAFFSRMLDGPGAVRRVLHETVSGGCPS
ncbi:MAG: mannitol dehydrogenase family protein [Oscillospiraceae bacterium]|jgi:fructuronate reductase|nr:mannitol dehydrogenase family protein [Oscillospiraceae bacterium]